MELSKRNKRFRFELAWKNTDVSLRFSYVMHAGIIMNSIISYKAQVEVLTCNKYQGRQF